MTQPVQNWSHDALAHDLAKWLKSGAQHWCWENAALGEWGGPRPDVMAYRRFRYNAPVIRAYEAKISRADLLSDLRAEKWRSYLEHCMSVTFIMPSGLCKKDEIPAECGVMFRSGRGWRTERRPQDIGVNCSTVAMAKLLTMHPMALPQTDVPKYRQDEWQSKARASFTRDMGDRFSREVAVYFAAVAQGRDPAAIAQEKADKIIAEANREAETIRKSLTAVTEALGISPDAKEWTLAAEIRKRAKLLSADGQMSAVRGELAKIQSALDAATRAVTPVLEQAA